MGKDDLGNLPDRVTLTMPRLRQQSQVESPSLKANEKNEPSTVDPQMLGGEDKTLLPWDFDEEGGIEESLARIKETVDTLRGGVRKKLHCEYLKCGRIYIGLQTNNKAWNDFIGLKDWPKGFCPEDTQEGRLGCFRFVLARLETGFDLAGRKKASKAAIALAPLMQTGRSEADILKTISEAGGIQNLAKIHAKKASDSRVKCFGSACEALLTTREVRMSAIIVVTEANGERAIEVIETHIVSG